MTSLDTILGTAGIDPTDLTATVTQHRSMSTNMELVLADQAPEQEDHVREVGLEPDSSLGPFWSCSVNWHRFPREQGT